MTQPAHKPPVTIDPHKARTALGDPDTCAFALLTIAMWAFGEEVLGDPDRDIEAMDPSELWAGLNEMFGVWVSEEGENKLNALMLALQGDLFYRDVEVFSAVAQALLDGDLGDLVQGTFATLTATDIMWAILEVELARDDEQGPPEFSQGVADLISRSIALEQEEQDTNTEAVREAYEILLDQLRSLGIPLSAIRLLDAEYAETLEVFESEAAIQAQVVP